MLPRRDRDALVTALRAAGCVFAEDEARLLMEHASTPAELDAARTAGMQTVLVLRPGNKPVDEGHGHKVISSFTQLEFV